MNPIMVATAPPWRTASSTSSNARAEISTPAPNAMIPAMILGGTRTHQAIAAPMTSAPPATRPHSPASSHVGICFLLLLPDRAAPVGPRSGPPRRSPAELQDDLDVVVVLERRERLDQHRSVRLRRLRNIPHLRRVLDPWSDRRRLHNICVPAIN